MSHIISSNNAAYQEAYNTWLLKKKSDKTRATYKESLRRAAIMCNAENVFDFMVMLTSISAQAKIYHQMVNGVDPFLIRRQSGHKSNEMIDRYDVRPDDALRDIMQNTDNI